MATISDLPDTLLGPAVSVVEPEVPDSTTFSEFIQRDRADFDQGNINTIQIVTDDLIGHLRGFVDVEAANTLREHAHNKINIQKQNSWKDNVIPIVMELGSQDNGAHLILSQAYGAVRDLGIEIQKASKTLCLTGGSSTTSEVATTNIQVALAKLNEFIAKAESSDASQINSFATDSEKLFRIIGEEAGNFAKRKQEIEARLEELYVIRNRKLEEGAQCEAEVDLYARLVDATQEHLSVKQAEIAENNLLIEELYKLNAETHAKIATDTNTLVNRKNYWFWRKKKISCEMYSDLEAEINYHQSRIFARMMQIRETKERNESVKLKIADLSHVLDHYKPIYEWVEKKDECLKHIYPVSSLERLQHEIDRLLETLEELSKQQLDFENKLEISGCSPTYSTFVSMLKGIKAMVECDIELLSGSNADILIAVNRLSEYGGFLTKYDTSSLHLLDHLDEKP